jgi:hypothetical protein
LFLPLGPHARSSSSSTHLSGLLTLLPVPPRLFADVPSLLDLCLDWVIAQKYCISLFVQYILLLSVAPPHSIPNFYRIVNPNTFHIALDIWCRARNLEQLHTLSSTKFNNSCPQPFYPLIPTFKGASSLMTCISALNVSA